MLKLFYKRVRLFSSLLYCKTFHKKAPIVLYLLLTDRCQMRCRYCFVDHVNTRREMTTKEVFNLIDEACKLGCKMICLMGGEPLLREDINEIVDYIQSKGIICDMTTNGLLIKDKIKVVKKIDSLMVSLDGDEKGNDLNRGVGTYQKIVEGIKVARKEGVIVRVNMVLTKNNKDSIGKMLDFAVKNNLLVTFAITAEASGGSEKIKDILLSREEIKKVYEVIKVLKCEGETILLSKEGIDYMLNYPLSFTEVIDKNDSKNIRYYLNECMFGRTMGYVDANGKVYPCAGLWQSFKAKSVLDVGLKEAWKNMNDLPCHTCWCAGGPEWDRIVSLRGILDGLKITLTQLVNNKRGE